MKNKYSLEYQELYTNLNDSEKDLLDAFFADFNLRFLLNKIDKRNLILDFENAIVYYYKNNYSIEQILEILDLSRIGGFYARDTELWFPLDDGAKIFPLAMRHGMMSVFRLSAYLDSEIIPELLQIALNFTIKRFPSFATTLKKGFFWHYLDISKRRYYIEEENYIPTQAIKVSGSRSQSFRVLYYKNKISVEFFHVLTDGNGGMVFLKALVIEYMRLLGVKVNDLDPSLDTSKAPMIEEYSNEFSNIKTDDSPSGFSDKRAIQLNGKLSKNNPCRILHFKIPTDKLKEISKKRKCTITAYLLTLMMLSFYASTDCIKGEFSVQVPVNMRKFYSSKTVRNFALYSGIRSDIKKVKKTDEFFEEISSQLKEKTSYESMSRMLSSTRRLVRLLKFIPLIIKKPFTRILYNFFSDDIFTSVFSNLGEVKFPLEISSHIESMDFALGTSFYNRASCSAVSINNVTTFTITKHTLDPSFEEEMYRLLLEDGLSVAVEGSVIYEN